MTATLAESALVGLAEQVCEFVTRATGMEWPAPLVDDLALVLTAVADFDRDWVRSARYRPRNNLTWLRGSTTHDHANHVVVRSCEVYGLSRPIAVALSHIALGTDGFDDPGGHGTSSALRAALTDASEVSDRVAHRWAASLARAVAGGPVPVAVTNRLRSEVARYRRRSGSTFGRDQAPLV